LLTPKFHEHRRAEFPGHSGLTNQRTWDSICSRALWLSVVGISLKRPG
jgi:hypothetical protein